MSEFKPVSRYYQAMDMVLCMAEDVSYRAQSATDFLEVLWHPTERYLVGVKVTHAKRIHRTLAMIPLDQPLSLLLLICGAILESSMLVVPADVMVALQDFLQQHQTGLNISPVERARIDFTLAPTG